LTSYSTPNKEEKPEYLYRLNGVVEHSGSLGGGHYVAYVRKFLQENGDDSTTMNNSESSATSKWFYFSDTHFREITEKEVMRAQAYLLFYERYRSK
jgi:ubiquitin carboxyl-terminal hydrolase 16/45